MQLLNRFTWVLFFVALVGCEEQPSNKADVKEQISQTWRQYLDFWEQGDANAAASFFTEDAINMPSYNSTQNGRAEVEAMFADLLSSTKVDVISRTTDEVFSHDGMAYEFGSIEQKFQRQGSTESAVVKIRYVSVFKQQADGSWKWHRWLGQSDQ
ncbi:MAG: YybH family protein [bacterium]